MRPGIVTTLLIIAACTVPEYGHAATPPRHKLAPPWFCTEENNLEIFVDEDRIMYACECRQLVDDVECAWQVIGGVESRAVRKFRKQHHRLVISYARPVVTA